MSFRIQVCNPQFCRNEDDEVESLRDAVEASFEWPTEDAIFQWNQVCFRVEYKYDLSVLVEDVLDMLQCLLSSSQGQRTIVFGSDTFNARWNMHWSAGHLSIRPIWRSMAGPKELPAAVRETLEVEIGEFTAEWKLLLLKIIEALKASGFWVNCEEEFRRLREIESKISNVGQLYRLE